MLGTCCCNSVQIWSNVQTLSSQSLHFSPHCNRVPAVINYRQERTFKTIQGWKPRVVGSMHDHILAVSSAQVYSAWIQTDMKLLLAFVELPLNLDPSICFSSSSAGLETTSQIKPSRVVRWGMRKRFWQVQTVTSLTCFDRFETNSHAHCWATNLSARGKHPLLSWNLRAKPKLPWWSPPYCVQLNSWCQLKGWRVLLKHG